MKKDNDITLKYAQQNGYEQIELLGVWNGFNIYHAIPKELANQKADEEPPTIGLPQFIMERDGKARFANHDETMDLMRQYCE